MCPTPDPQDLFRARSAVETEHATRCTRCSRRWARFPPPAARANRPSRCHYHWYYRAPQDRHTDAHLFTRCPRENPGYLRDGVVGYWYSWVVAPPRWYPEVVNPGEYPAGVRGVTHRWHPREYLRGSSLRSRETGGEPEGVPTGAAVGVKRRHVPYIVRSRATRDGSYHMSSGRR